MGAFSDPFLPVVDGFKKVSQSKSGQISWRYTNPKLPKAHHFTHLQASMSTDKTGKIPIDAATGGQKSPQSFTYQYSDANKGKLTSSMYDHPETCETVTNFD